MMPKLCKKHVQFANGPLHDTKMVHHLDERNEEDDCSELRWVCLNNVENVSSSNQTYHADKEPSGGTFIEEKDSSNMGLSQEVCSELGNPAEDGETGASLQDEQGNGLL